MKFKFIQGFTGVLIVLKVAIFCLSSKDNLLKTNKYEEFDEKSTNIQECYEGIEYHELISKYFHGIKTEENNMKLFHYNFEYLKLIYKKTYSLNFEKENNLPPVIMKFLSYYHKASEEDIKILRINFETIRTFYKKILIKGMIILKNNSNAKVYLSDFRHKGLDFPIGIAELSEMVYGLIDEEDINEYMKKKYRLYKESFSWKKSITLYMDRFAIYMKNIYPGVLVDNVKKVKNDTDKEKNLVLKTEEEFMMKIDKDFILEKIRCALENEINFLCLNRTIGPDYILKNKTEFKWLLKHLQKSTSQKYKH